MSPEATTAIKFLAEALLHNLWQGAVLAGLLLVVLRWVPARSAQLRYWAGMIAFFLLVFSVPVTVGVLSVLDQKADYPALIASASMPVSDFGSSVDAPVGFSGDVDRVPSVESVGNVDFERESLVWQEWLLIVWILGAAAGMLRVFRSAAGVRRLRKEAKPLSGLVSDDLARRCGLRKEVPIRESARVATACICGFFRPVVLLPVSMVTALTPEQLEVVIVHEFAHLKRLDPLWNLCQLIAEALLFFNPFLWWISESVRNEREACCDEFVIRAMGRKRDYLEALLRSSETAVGIALAGTLAFSGGNQGGGPLARIQRILKPDAVPEIRVRLSFLVGLIIAGLAFSWAALAGSESVVRALTAEERIERIEAVRAAYPQYGLEAAAGASISEPEKDILISGQLLRPDGRRLEGAVKIIAFSNTGRRRIQSSQRTDREGSFSFNVKAGIVSLLFQPDDYAPLRVEFGSIDADQENLEYTLDTGYSAKIRFSDALTGQPLPGVEVEVRPGGNPQGYPASIQADEGGSVVFEHLMSGGPIQLSALKPGYGEGLWKELRLDEDEALELMLDPVAPFVARVRGASGEPLEGAELRIAARKGTGMNMSFGDSGNVLAVSDGDGLLQAESLRNDSLYYFLVKRAGYLGKGIGPFSQGQSVELVLEKRRSVQIDISGLDPKASIAEAKLSQTLKTGDASYGLLPEKVLLHPIEGHASFTYEPQLDLPLDLEIGDLEFTFAPEEWKQGALSVRFPNPQWPTDDGGAASEIKVGRVALRIQVPEGGPPATGSVLVNYLKNGDRVGVRREETYQSVPIIAGVGKLVLPVPNRISIEAEGLTGYWFKPRRSIEIGASGDGENEISVEAVAAGGIYGRVVDGDGNSVDGVLISVSEAMPEEARLRGSRNLGIKVKNSAYPGDRRDRYLASPLPLDGTYIVRVSKGYNYHFSEPVSLTPEDPIREVNLKLPDGITVNGRVLHPDGSPVALHPIKLIIDAEGGHSFSGGGIMTGADGSFTIEGVNADVRGTTYLAVQGVEGCQPIRHRVDFGADSQEIRLKAGRRISGQVINQKTGRPVVGAEIYATREPYVSGAWPNWFGTEDTDEAGHFEF